MTRDELIRMAVHCCLVHSGNRNGIYMDALEDFAELVAAAERKSCIDDCNAEAATEGTAQRIIQRICARGQE